MKHIQLLYEVKVFKIRLNVQLHT